MTKAHKKALARGREQARAVRDYLEHLERQRRAGPKVTTVKVADRIEQTRRDIAGEDDPAARVELIQRRLDDEDLLARLRAEPDTDDLEAAFVDVVADYSERKGITYSAWRELGVPAAALRRGGVPRTRRTVAAA